MLGSLAGSGEDSAGLADVSLVVLEVLAVLVVLLALPLPALLLLAAGGGVSGPPGDGVS